MTPPYSSGMKTASTGPTPSAVAFLGYAVPPIVDSIWKSQRWSVTGKFIFDGVLYALVTAGSFAWLWPEIDVA